MSDRLQWTVKTTEMGKLVAFLSSKFPLASQKQLRRALDARCCEVNGRVERFANAKLRPGDQVIFYGDLGEHKKKQASSFDRSAILYEDDFLIAYNKPPGVSCDANGVLLLLASEYPQLYLVHRLDKQTSGVLLLAKDRKTQETFEVLFRGRLVKKIYLAVVDGIPTEKKGKVENFVKKLGSYGHGQQRWGVVDEGGKIAITEWKIKESRDDSALLVCLPLTGRTHQIRVQLAHMGHPILGDFQYSTTFKSEQRPQRHLLHAWKVSFPLGEEEKTIVAPIPEDMMEQGTKET